MWTIWTTWTIWLHGPKKPDGPDTPDSPHHQSMSQGGHLAIWLPEPHHPAMHAIATTGHDPTHPIPCSCARRPARPQVATCTPTWTSWPSGPPAPPNRGTWPRCPRWPRCPHRVDAWPPAPAPGLRGGRGSGEGGMLGRSPPPWAGVLCAVRHRLDLPGQTRPTGQRLAPSPASAPDARQRAPTSPGVPPPAPLPPHCPSRPPRGGCGQGGHPRTTWPTWPSNRHAYGQGPLAAPSRKSSHRSRRIWYRRISSPSTGSSAFPSIKTSPPSPVE